MGDKAKVMDMFKELGSARPLVVSSVSNEDYCHTVKFQYGELKGEVHQTQMPDFKGKLALKLIEQWGLVTAIPDGEDSKGRQKGALESPEELVARAIKAADIAIDQMKELGWLTPVPVLYDFLLDDDTQAD